MKKAGWPSPAPRSFLCRETLFPDESLPSYLFRLAEANGYQLFPLFEAVCKERLTALGVRGSLTRSARPETYVILSELTGTNPRALAQATIHHLAHAPALTDFNPPKIVLSDGQPLSIFEKWRRPTLLRPESRAQFCPACLRETAYHRLCWSLQEVTACCHHPGWLLETCPGCGAGVSVQAVARRRCSACAQDLGKTSGFSLQDQPFVLFAQRIVQSWWGFVPPARSAAWTLPPAPVPVLYRVWARLLEILTCKLHIEHAVGLLETMPARRALQEIVFRALVDWPHGFYAFLRVYLPQKPLARTVFHPNAANLDALRLSWEEEGWATDPDMAFVQTAFEAFMAGRGAL
jgi:hypothetical protein